MSDDRSPGRALPEALTRLLTAPESAIRPTPDGRGRAGRGPGRVPSASRAVKGVWLWALMFNVLGFAILAALWSSMG